MSNRFEKTFNAPAPAPAIAGKTILEPAKVKADQEHALTRDVLGLAIRETDQFYVNGTKMLDCGEARAHELRRQWEALPTVAESMDKLVTIIKGEERLDYKAKVRDLRLGTSGLLEGANGGIVLTENSFGQLVSNFRGEGAKSVPPRLRNNFNLWAHRSEKTVTLRTRNPQEDGTRTAFAAVGARYASFDIDRVAEEIATVMPKDAHATFVYQDARVLIDVSLAPTFEVGELGVGRVHRVHCLASTADDGTESGVVRYAAERIRCINCTTIQDERLVFKRRHVGDSFVDLFRSALGKAGLAMEVFGAAWRAANEAKIADASDGSPLSAEETFRRLIAHEYVHVPWVPKAKLLEMLMEAFEKEPGPGAAHINMAITRMAHERIGDWRSPWYVQSLEEQAGKLLFDQVYDLPKLNTSQQEMFS